MAKNTYKAKLLYARISARKVRRIANLIRGKNVNRALDILSIVPNRASFFLYYLLKSAISNANNINPKVNVDSLQISHLVVGDGPIMKRFRAMPRGQAGLIRKHFSHIYVELTGFIPVEEKKTRKRKTKKVEKPEAKEKGTDRKKGKETAKPKVEKQSSEGKKVKETAKSKA